MRLSLHPSLGHGRHDPRDILRPRQTMVAVLDHGQHHVVARQPVRQREGVPPRHVGVLRALQDANRATHIDGAAEQQMVAAFLDQRARDRIGRAIGRRPQPHALGLDLLPDLRRKALPHQLFGEIRRRRDQYQAGQRCIAAAAPGDLARQQQRHPAAHRRADHDLRARAEPLEHRDAFFQPAPDRAVDEGAAGFAVAGIIEPDAGAVVLGGPGIQRDAPWCPACPN